MNLSTVMWVLWDKTQSRELLVLFMCVCSSLCIQLLHTILHRTDLIIFPLAIQTITIAPMMSIWWKRGTILLHMSSQYGSGVWGTPANFNGFRFASWLPYCSDVAQRKSTKLCMMFGRLLGWCTMYTFSGALAHLREFCQVQNSLCIQILRSSTMCPQKRPPKYNGVVFEILGKHHWNFYNII